MQLNIGTKIKELRRRDGRTQEALAEALGVTNQAVSRWESGGSYPDMEIVPAIANYFHVSIDELFGYQNDREERIKTIIEKAKHHMHMQGTVLGKGLGEYESCVNMLREALDEFPNEPEILYMLAEALHRLGWQKHGRAIRKEDEDTGHYSDNIEYNAKNTYWWDALQVYEKLLKMDISSNRRGEIVQVASMMYKCMGEHEKAKALVRAQDSILYSREVLLSRATVGEEREQVQGESIINCLRGLQWILSGAFDKRETHITEYDRSILLALAHMYELIFSDGRCGGEHAMIGLIYRSLAKREVVGGGDLQKAIAYFDKSFTHYKEYKEICGHGDYQYSAPLVSKVVVSGDKLSAVSNNYWKEIWDGLPESLVTELRQNPKYAECFA